MKNSKKTQNNNSSKNIQTHKGHFLITRNGLELCKVTKSTSLCHVVLRENKTKPEYCYKVRFIENPNETQIKQFGLKK